VAEKRSAAVVTYPDVLPHLHAEDIPDMVDIAPRYENLIFLHLFRFYKKLIHT
jgi:hypothetical protein